MKLQRISKQYSENIEKYYEHLKHDCSEPKSTRIQMMIDLIRHLEAQKLDVEPWVYTSGERLVFTNVDDIAPGVAVELIGKFYIITYPLALEDAPWEGALMEGATPDMDEATQMIALALQRLRKESR